MASSAAAAAGRRLLASQSGILERMGGAGAEWCKAAASSSMHQGFSAVSLDEERSKSSTITSLPLSSLHAPPAVRGFATMGMRSAARPSMGLGLNRLPLGLGLGQTSLPQGLKQQQSHIGLQPSAQPSAARTYLTEGQVLGSAFLLSTDIMFWSGLIGAVVFRRNLIVMLLATEIVMLACNLNFLFASAYFNDMTGVIMSITITTIAACETAIGLALCVTYFHLRSATDVEALNFLK